MTTKFCMNFVLVMTNYANYDLQTELKFFSLFMFSGLRLTFCKGNVGLKAVQWLSAL